MTNLNQNDKLVSVLIAVFNSKDYIKECIDSVLNQTYTNLEIIILDDCSTDDTFNILSKIAILDKRIKIYKNEKNIGYLKTFNILLTLANGEYISFIDSDDIIDENKILKQLNYLKTDSTLAFVGTGYHKIDEKGNVFGTVLLPYTKDEIIDNIIDINKMPICGSSILIKKDVIEEVGGYNEYFTSCPGEDIDWVARILYNYNGINIQEALYYYRFRENSLTRKVFDTVKQRHIREIITFLYMQRLKNNGKDSLTKELKGLKSFIDQLEKPYKLDKGLMFRKMSFDYAVNRNFKQSFKYLLKSFIKINLNSFKLIIYIFILLIFKKTFLLKIMNLFNIKNLSKRL